MRCKRDAMLRTSYAISALMALILISGCSHTVKPEVAENLSSRVDRHQILPDESARMRLEDNQVVIPGELTNPDVMPAYPERLLPLRLPDQTVCVSFVVNTDGSVSNITPVYGVEGCPGSAADTHPEFVVATVDAVSRWDFFSYIRCTFPPGTPDAQKCNGPGAISEQVAVTLVYRFLFSFRNGVSTVQRVADQ